MSTNYHLIYVGSEGVVFGQLLFGVHLGAVNISIVSKTHAVLKVSSLPGYIHDRRAGVWKGGLTILFRGTKIDPSTGDYLIPIKSLLAPFWNHPPSDAAVDQILKDLGQTRISRAFRWTSKVFPEGPGIASCLLSWAGSRDTAWRARRKRMRRKRKQPGYGHPLLRHDALDLAVLAHWDVLRAPDRREIFLEELLLAVGDYAPGEAGFWDSKMSEYSNRGNSALIKYLKNRRIRGFKVGRPKKKLPSISRGKSPSLEE